MISGTTLYPRTDEQLIAYIYEQAFSLQLFDPARQARSAVVLGRETPGGREILYSLIDRLLHLEPHGPAEGIGLLSAASADDGVADRFAPTVSRMLAHPDFAVSVTAVRLARNWGLKIEQPKRRLPSYYDIIFDDAERGEVFLAPPEPLGLNAIDDPLAWTWLFERPIRLLSEATGITVMQLRRRCHQFIGEIGGLETIKLGPNHQQMPKLARLEMRLVFPRPYITAST
jgi:hypothetical protein